MLKTYYKYLGKAKKDSHICQLIPYHCLDVAAVAATWWETSRAIRNHFKSPTSYPLRFRKGKVDRAGKIMPIRYQELLKVEVPESMKELVWKGVGPAKGFG